MRLSPLGVRSRALEAARKLARSRSDHSHSRFCRNAIWSGKVLVLSVVSIWKIFTPEAAISLPMRQFELRSSELCSSMNERLLQQRAHVVVVLQAAVGGEAGRDRLVAAVHGDEVDVHVDQQVALGRPPVDLDVLAVVGQPEVDEVRGVLGVVLEQEAVGREGLEDAVAEGVAQLGVGHAAVKGEGRDEHDVVDARLGREVEDGLDDPLAHVGRAHRGERERDVVEGDREPHARTNSKLRSGCGVPERVLEGVADGAVGISERVEGLGPVDDPRPDGKAFETEALAVPQQRRRGRAVDLEDEAGPRAHFASLVVLATCCLC